MSRINYIVKELIPVTQNPDDLMFEVIGALTDVDIVPDVGGYYTFIYKPKTPNIQYDEHPFVNVTAVFGWGFRAMNYHWNRPRQYTYQEVVGNLHIVRAMEVDDMKRIPTAKIRLNN